ncbi:hypothetical protein ACFL20_05555 [Spirochaetota bacterium]
MNKSMVFIYFILLTIFVPVSAFAYLDPATGSYIIQIVIAGILTSLFVIKHYWKKITSKLMSLFGKGKDNGES